MGITPGEWVGKTYSMPTGADDFECGASILAEDLVTGHRKEVAFVHELPEQYANLKLIAAAPDLLSVAQFVVQATTGNIPPGIVQAARDAIKKATFIEE